MKRKFGIIVFLILISHLSVIKTYGQAWNFVKEEDGIKIYTRNEGSNSMKSYKGVTVFSAPMEKVCCMVGNARNFDWWGEDFKQIRVLGYEEKKYVRYYYIYDMPWPLTDRDLAVEATVKTNSATGEYKVISQPLLKVVPENPDLVRIKSYWQTWTIQPLDKGYVSITLEGFVDPGGNVPGWLYNMLSTEMPLRTMRLFRQRVLSDKPAN